jgi:hypothetical protein
MEECTVQIGIGRNSKLSAAMKRYVQVCNNHKPADTRDLEVTDLDFVHVQLLNPQDTPENAAVMKHDKISVRREQSAERQANKERLRLQRDCDKEFLVMMRNLLLLNKGDVTIICGDSLRFEAYACFLRLRCPWLGALISQAGYDQRKHQQSHSATIAIRQQPSPAPSYDTDECVHPSAAKPANAQHAAARLVLHDLEHDHADAATTIENDEDDDQPNNGIYIYLVDYPGDAVLALLEYLYTNRVVALGMEAFTVACKTKPSSKVQGPVPPFPPRRWPNKGDPSISLLSCLALIRLAETASLPRLSLMAEVAATVLLNRDFVLHALELCQEQALATGNPLPRLRRAAMERLLVSEKLLSSRLLQRALEKGRMSVPTLLLGAKEAILEERVQMNEALVKRRQLLKDPTRWQENAFARFSVIDQIDKTKRAEERLKHRRSSVDKTKAPQRRREAPPRRGLKRSAGHLRSDSPRVRFAANATVMSPRTPTKR